MSSKHPTLQAHPLLQGGSELTAIYNEVVACDLCPRITEFRKRIAKDKRKQFMDWSYWGQGVPGYGDHNAEILLIGLAPAAHGGNRTGRVFTGDKSAEFLVMCLHEVGLANQPNSDSLDDGLELNNTFMTPVLKCVPPQDKPTAEELKNCSSFFSREMDQLKNVKVILALGKIGFDGCLRYFRQFYNLKMKDYPFGHNVSYNLPNNILLMGSYHPSPRNVNTGRLNKEMMIDLLKSLPV